MRITAIKATAKHVVRDILGRKIPYVVEYDTDTCEIVMVPHIAEGNQFVTIEGEYGNTVLKVTGIATGSYLEIDGVRYVGP